MGGETENFMEIYNALIKVGIYKSVEEAKKSYESMVEESIYNSMDEVLGKVKEIIDSHIWFAEVDEHIFLFSSRLLKFFVDLDYERKQYRPLFTSWWWT